MATTINANNTDGVVITPDTSGEIELQANGVTKAKVTANGLQDANGASLRGGMYRNLIINGDMKIAQRGTSATGLTNGSTGYHTVDRWFWSESGATTSVWSMSQDTNVPTGQGFGYSLKLQCTTAQASLAAGDALYFRQRIEGQNLQQLSYGTSSAESLTLSFWIKSNKTGTYTVEFWQPDISRIISRQYTISAANTWEKKTLTVPGDTSGQIDNNNDTGLELFFWYGAGTNYTSGTLQTSWGALNLPDRAVGQVNLADSTSNYINITGVQLEVGEGASDFEFLPYDVQLARCQRYYEETLNSVSFVKINGYGTHNGQKVLNTEFKTTKRAGPTVVIYDNAGTPASNKLSTYDSAGTRTDGQTVALVQTDLQQIKVYPNNGTYSGIGFYYTADAEL